MKKEFPGATINYVPGTQFLSQRRRARACRSALTTDGKPGVKVTYSEAGRVATSIDAERDSRAARNAVSSRTIDIAAQTAARRGCIGASRSRCAGKATLTPTETGDYNLGVEADGFFRIVARRQARDQRDYPHGNRRRKTGPRAPRSRQAGTAVRDYAPHRQRGHRIGTLMWTKVDRSRSPAAVAAAKNADVVVAVVGITSELEGEEMQVNEPGFKGGDRTSLDLPKPEEDLLKALAATGKPLVVVLTNGSALAVNWAKEHANAILDAWYPGEEGGTAVARDSLRTQQSRGAPAGDLLHRRRPVAAV